MYEVTNGNTMSLHNSYYKQSIIFWNFCEVYKPILYYMYILYIIYTYLLCGVCDSRLAYAALETYKTGL